MKKYLMLSLFCLLAGFVSAFFVIHPKAIPGPVQYKDKIIYAHMSGQAIITPTKPQDDQQGREVILQSTPSSDFKTAVPVTGIIETKRIKVEFTGVTMVERKGDLLTVDTVFNPDVTETIKQEPVKTWHVGTYFDGSFGGYIQKDFPIWHNAVGFGRLEVDRDRRLMSGIEISF